MTFHDRWHEERETTAVIPTYNEADEIERTLRQVEEIVAEVVIVDSSDDDTLDIARDASEDLNFDLITEYVEDTSALSNGMGHLRRLGADLSSNKFVLQMDADMDVETWNPDWFTSKRHHAMYFVTVVEYNDHVHGERLLYDKDNEEDVRMRGMVGERLYKPDGGHPDTQLSYSEAPLTLTKRRESAFNTTSMTYCGQHSHMHDDRSREVMRRFHYLLRESMHRSFMQALLTEDFFDYYGHNTQLVTDDWAEVKDDYNVVQSAIEPKGELENNPLYKNFDLETGEPFMSADDQSFIDYAGRKIKEKIL